MTRPSLSAPSVKAPWMTPGVPRIAKPSWLRFEPAPPSVPEPPPPTPLPAALPPSVELLSPLPPPRTSLRPSMPPPSRRMPPAQIQTAREIELEGEVAHLRAELERAKDETEAMRARVMEESEPAIVSLALAIAKRIVGREVTKDPALMHVWVREAQGLLPRGELFVAPDVKGLDAEVDPLLSPGTAEVRDGASVVTVGADARVAAMADALGQGT